MSYLYPHRMLIGFHRKDKVPGNIFRDLRFSTVHGTSQELAADICCVELQTYKLWEKKGGPLWAARLLQRETNWFVSDPAGAWNGWRLSGGLLWSPADISYTPGDLLAAHYQVQQIRALETENRTLKSEVDRLSEPAPELPNNIIEFPGKYKGV